jgi:3-hydroxybutyrate dehydrogenase
MLKDRVAIVTGSTSGIGLGIATALAEAGCNIMLNGFGPLDAIKETQAELAGRTGVKVSYSGADVTKADEVTAMVRQAEKELGMVGIVVNNAGIQYVELIENFPPEKWDAILATNLSSAFHIIRMVLPTMKQAEWGRIINIASAHGLVASAKKSAYVAAKHGIVGLTKSVALEVAGSGITCNAICPGWVLTPLVEKQIADIANSQRVNFNEAKLRLLAEKQPSKQFVTIEEIGALTSFLVSDHARSITGTTIAIDGGWTAQ